MSNHRATPRIRVLCPNPKQPGSAAWRRFNLYRDGMTPDEFRLAGGKRSDLRNDESKGFIKITTLYDTFDVKPTQNRAAAVNRIRNLLNKTLENGCTEQEAMSAAAKAGELMDRYGIESSETEIKAEKCHTDVHGAGRKRPHESQWVSSMVAEYCNCRVWRRTGTGAIAFFGLPSDVEVATYLMRIIEGAMDRSFRTFRHTPEYTAEPGERNTFMLAFTGRVSARLREMLKARHQETLVTTTGTSLMVVKNAVVKEQFDALGFKLRRASSTTIRTSNSDAARAAGSAAGDRVHLGTAVTGGSAKLRLS